ncbi:MAG: sodium/proline symporter [Chlamydiia bacterium]|nr:sodium/proline symporter [Chlamydiia bacterium]
MTQVLAIGFYFLCALGVGAFSYKKRSSVADFLMGGRSLNYWLTALAAHASDMSNWLFMGYPAMIFVGGLFNGWVAIGLTLCMYLNWQWIAPKLRALTEKSGDLTLSGFFETRLSDHTGLIRLFSAGLCFLFYAVYIAAGLVGLGLLSESFFGISYEVGITCGIAIVIAYVLIGGYVTLAWLDLFQGLFLLGIIIAVPLLLLPSIGGVSQLSTTTSLLPNFKGATLFSIVSLTLGWGLGYFGQPHILTKFMGIRETSQIKQSKRVGMSWMVLSLFAATCVGLVATAYFTGGIDDPEMIFIEMVKRSFSPFAASFILCAIIAAIINVMSSQMLVISSILSEDFYKKFFKKSATDQKGLLISRLSMIGVGLLALCVAALKPASIFQLVQYAWSGLGASFGPLLLYSIYGKNRSRLGAWIGMLAGGTASALWPLLKLPIDPLLPAFSLNLLILFFVSVFKACRVKNHNAI